MNRIVLDNVSVEMPIYTSHGRSLRVALMRHAVGGNVSSRKRDDIVVVRALDRVSVTFEDGQRIGIIGGNGAGKTTLLRVCAGVYPPTAGTATINGAVSALTDLTLGMDFEASGYENIVIRSILMGRTRQQANAIVSDVETFTELGQYLSLPIRTYSSGMLLRLGFAIATATSPNILIMDEMIGVGDAAFVDKALARIESVMSEADVFLLASHNEKLIRQMCRRVIWMKEGKIFADGPVEQVMDLYRKAAN